MFYFLCSNRTVTKIKYKFDILTRMTAVFGNTTDIVI